MKTTYKNSDRGRPPGRSRSSTQEIKNIFGKRDSRHFSNVAANEAHEQVAQQLLNHRPSIAPEAAKAGRTSTITFMSRQHEYYKLTQQERNLEGIARSYPMEHISTGEVVSEHSMITPDRRVTATQQPKSAWMTLSEDVVLASARRLKRKKNFHLERTLRALEIEGGNDTTTASNVSKMQAACGRVSDSQINNPSPLDLASDACAHSRPPAQSLYQPSIKHKKTGSTSSRFSSYAGTSADLLDARRQEIQSTIRKNFEKAGKVFAGKLPLLPQTLDYFSREQIIDDDDSDESFFCIGERRMSDLDKERRISGSGHDPWVEGLLNECRLCGKPNPGRLKGLCRDCEIEFRRPKTCLIDSDDPPEEIKQPSP